MRGLRYSIGLLLAAVWIAPLRAQQPDRHHPRARHRCSRPSCRSGEQRSGSGARAPRPGPDGGYLLTDVPAGHGHAAGDDDRLRAGGPGRHGRRPARRWTWMSP